MLPTKCNTNSKVCAYLEEPTQIRCVFKCLAKFSGPTMFKSKNMQLLLRSWWASDSTVASSAGCRTPPYLDREQVLTMWDIVWISSQSQRFLMAWPISWGTLFSQYFNPKQTLTYTDCVHSTGYSTESFSKLTAEYCLFKHSGGPSSSRSSSSSINCKYITNNITLKFIKKIKFILLIFNQVSPIAEKVEIDFILYEINY